LTGDNIYVSEVYDDRTYSNNTNISFQNYGDRNVYFYLDNNAKIVNFILNISGYQYGFEFENDSFDTYKDDVLSNASTIGTFIFPAKSATSGWLNFGNFSTDTVWDFTLDDYTYNPNEDHGLHDEYCEEYSTTKETSTMVAYSELDGEDCLYLEDSSDSETITSSINLFNYTDVLNSLSFEKVSFDIDLDISLKERFLWTLDPDECEWDFEFNIGGTNLIDMDERDQIFSNINCYDWSDGICYFDGDYDITITIERNSEDSDYLYTAFLNGTGYLEADYDDEEDCEWAKRFIYFNNGTTYIYTNPACGATANSTVNSIFQFNPSGSDMAFRIINKIHGDYGGDTIFKGCAFEFLNTSVNNVSIKLNSYDNSTYTSTSVFDSSANLNTINITTTGVWDGTTYLSADDGDNWQSVTEGADSSLTNPGKNIKWKVEIVPESGFLTVIPYISNVLIKTEKGDPSNVSLDFGNDGIYDYTMSGYLNGTNQTLEVNLTDANISGAFTGNAESGQTWLIPLRVFSATRGIININTINLTYDPNPVYLNLTSIRDYLKGLINMSTLNISVRSIAGILNLTDLRYDYAGGNETYEILAHNDDYSVNVTRNVTAYFSQWDYEWIPNVRYIYFQPSTPNSVNVTPYGQTSTIPLFNITNLGYGGLDATLSAKINSSLNCVNTTMSLTSDKTDGIVLNETFQDLTNLTYLQTVNASFWADYACDYSNYTLYNPSLFLRQCVVGGECSMEVV